MALNFRGTIPDPFQPTVAPEALYWHFLHKPHTTKNLYSIVGDLVTDTGGKVLGHRHFLDHVLTGGNAGGNAISEFRRGFCLGGHVRQFMTQGLKPVEGFTKGFPLFHILQACFQRQPRRAVGHHRQIETFHLEVGHDHIETGVFLADEIRRRYPAIVKEQLSGIAGPPAHFFQLPAHTKTRGALFHQQQADATVAGITGTDCHGVVVCIDTTGDEGFGAVHHKVITLSRRFGAQVSYIGAATGLGDGKALNFATGNHVGADAGLERVTAPLHHRWQTNIDGTKAGRYPTGTGGHDLFTGSDLAEHIETGATVLLRVADTQNAGVTGFLIQVSGQFTSFFPALYIGGDLAGNKGPHRFPHQVLGFTKVALVVRHDLSSVLRLAGL